MWGANSSYRPLPFLFLRIGLFTLLSVLTRGVSLPEGRVAVGSNRRPPIGHELLEERQVVDGSENASEHLVSAVEMPQVGAGEIPARIAGALSFDGVVGLRQCEVLHLEGAGPREERGIPGIP